MEHVHHPTFGPVIVRLFWCSANPTSGALSSLNIAFPLAVNNCLKLEPAIVCFTTIHVYINKPEMLAVAEIEHLCELQYYIYKIINLKRRNLPPT